MLITRCSIEKYILQYLGGGFNASMVDCYIDCNFTSQGKSFPPDACWGKNRVLIGDRLSTAVRQGSLAGQCRQLPHRRPVELLVQT